MESNELERILKSGIFTDKSGAKWKYDEVQFWLCRDEARGEVRLSAEAMRQLISLDASVDEFRVPMKGYWFVDRLEPAEGKG